MCYLLPAKRIFALARLVLLHQLECMGFIDLFNHIDVGKVFASPRNRTVGLGKHLTCHSGEVRWGSRSSVC